MNRRSWLKGIACGACALLTKWWPKRESSSMTAEDAAKIRQMMDGMKWKATWRGDGPGDILEQREISIGGTKYKVGDIVWDVDHAWSRGLEDCLICHILLSRDLLHECPEDKTLYWNCARLWMTPHDWDNDGTGWSFMGDMTDKFTDRELNKMRLVGDMKQTLLKLTNQP